MALLSYSAALGSAVHSVDGHRCSAARGSAICSADGHRVILRNLVQGLGKLSYPLRRSPHQKHVPGSLRSFIWLCLGPVWWTSSSVPFDESTINLFVCLADSMALASATTSCRVFFVLSGFMCVLRSSVLV